MYLEQDDNIKLVDDIHKLTKGCGMIAINFSNGRPHHGEAFFKENLSKHGWKEEQSDMFGSENFNFGRYPEGKSPNKVFGWTIFTKSI